MVEIITLFLGLVLGVENVELAVEGPVAAVELWLDDLRVGRLEGKPWALEIDFGQRLEPRRLEAVALDAAGHRIGYSRQLINVGRANHEAVLVLESADPGPPRTGRVVWAAIFDQSPASVELTFDRRRLAVRPDGRFELPPYDVTRPHFLTAELFFPDGFSARAELGFGGLHGDRVVSALTAVPVHLPPGEEPPTPDEMIGWFRKGEERPRVFSTAPTGASLLIVRDVEAGRHLRRLAREIEVADLREIPTKDLAVSFVSPRPHRHHEGAFRVSDAPRSYVEAGLWALFTELHPRPDTGARQRLWNGVAAAARGAAESDRRRAVVALLGTKPKDRSPLSPAQVLGYLESLRVPCFLWAPSVAALARWGLPEDAPTFTGASGMADLFRDLAHSLSSQRIVWLEGEHLPNQLSLSDEAPPGVRLAE